MMTNSMQPLLSSISLGWPKRLIFSVLVCLHLGSLRPNCSAQDVSTRSEVQGQFSTVPSQNEPNIKKQIKKELAVFGGGCFWCIEAVFERVWGVHSVVSGYSGGNLPNPTYQQVLTDQTGHAEVIQIEYDPSIVTYEELLRIFFKSHDPTSLNAQGPDHGTRYRSVIYYRNKEEKQSIEELMEEFKKKRTFRGKIVTEVSPLKIFYQAEQYHQDYFAKHPDAPYCEINIRPKIGKFEKGFKDNSKLQKAKEQKLESAKK
ncbi:MAG: peptide-methionine (S)-S-oxide reductase MsrA [Planctomycetota bacterium]|jgi:peptide-methionine (S)-S-oxide reductase